MELIPIGRYYYVIASEVVCIERESLPAQSDPYPYMLTVCLSNGKNLSIKYKIEKERDAEVEKIARLINFALNRNEEKILCEMVNLKGAIKTIDKRQLKIWSQLKRLLNIEGEQK